MRWLKREILMVLAIKILLLSSLWYCCFSDPVAPKLNTHQLAQRLLGSAQTIAGFKQLHKEQ